MMRHIHHSLIKNRDTSLLSFALVGMMFLFFLTLVCNIAVTPATTIFSFSQPPIANAATTFTVNSTADGADASAGNGVCETATPGQCTLRAAIQESNALAGTDTVNFSIGSGLQRITVATTLPTISQTIILDGTTQPGFDSGTGVPLIELRGSGTTGSGFTLSASSSTIRGFIINGFSSSSGGNGINISGSSNTIDTNYIGTDSTGNATLSNGNSGILITGNTNTIGSINSVQKNVIANNLYSNRPCIYIGTSTVQTGSNNVIIGNYIGLKANGTATNGCGMTSGNGISIFSTGTGNVIGGAGSQYRNVISGALSNAIDNQYSSGLIIKGNYIGTNAAGTAGVTNAQGINATVLTYIGGPNPGEGNVISGCTTAIAIYNNNASTIKGNYIGTNAEGTAAIANSYGIYTSAMGPWTIGGTTAGDRNIISGNTVAGIYLSGTGSTPVIQGNYIGTNAAGTAAIANAVGIDIWSGSNHTIGGSAAGAGNVISGNTSAITTRGTAGVGGSVKGNIIGLNADGTGKVPNGTGFNLTSGSSSADWTIGGTTAAERNVISGNTGVGIQITSGQSGNMIIKGNYIGTNVAGTAALGNTAEGILLATQHATIGGTLAGEGNVISGNGNTATRAGLSLGNGGAVGSSYTVQGNYIGTNAAGTAALGNSLGIYVSYSSNTTATIGGTAAGAGNIISGSVATYSAGYGIQVLPSATSALTIQGNKIGTGVDGTENLGNASRGIYVGPTGACSTWQIGGTNAGETNIIKNNGGAGVFLNGTGTTWCKSTKIAGNSISNNAGVGIDLAPAGITANDANDPDVNGGNNLQNFPVITSATIVGGNTRVVGTLNSLANQTFALHFYSNTSCGSTNYGEGETYIGTGNTTTSGNNAAFTIDIPVTNTSGKYITATATSSTNDTSEFSACGAGNRVPGADLEVVSKTVDNGTPSIGNTVTYTITAKNNGPDSATNTTLTDALPAGLTFVSATPSVGSYVSGTGVWTIGTLANGATETLTLQASVDSGTQGTTITNTAGSIVSDLADSNSGNNSASVDIIVANPISCPAAAGSVGSDAYSVSPDFENGFCAFSAAPGNIDGTGWIPIDMTSLPGGSPISSFPIDPINELADPDHPASTDRVYRYVCQNDVSGTGKNSKAYEINMILESKAFTVDDNKMANDGGDNDNYYEFGTSLRLLGSGTGF